MIVAISEMWTLDGYMNMVEGCDISHPSERLPVDMADGSKRTACLRCIQRLGGPSIKSRHRTVKEARKILRGSRESPPFDPPLSVMDRVLRALPFSLRDVIITAACRQRRIEGMC